MRRAEQARTAGLMTGPAGAVPILRCRCLRRSLPLYAARGFQAEDLDGYAVLRNGTTEHLWQTSNTSPCGCLIRVPDAAALWQQLQGQEVLGPFEDDNPAMLSFAVLGPE